MLRSAHGGRGVTDARKASVLADCRKDGGEPGALRSWWQGRKAKAYEGSVSKGLEKAFWECDWEEDFELGEGRLVIFSDHHKGTRDGADDFWVAERAYSAALAYYREAGFKLAILGDGEELWENASPAEVMECYREVLDLERTFLEPGGPGLWRFYGNHDLQWKEPGLLGRHLGVEIEVHESLKLRVKRGDDTEGTLFLVHGHQGTLFSDRIPEVALPAVRYAWAPWQRRSKCSLNTPSRDYNLREAHESAMAAWAKEKRPTNEQVVLVAGHTHRPVFGARHQSVPEPPSRFQQDLDQARDDPARTEEVPSLAAGVERARAGERYYSNPEAFDPPCFFNTGCCSFSDGDVTGIELDGEEIRLIRWTKGPFDQPECLQCLPISAVLEAVNNRAELGEVRCLESEPEQR